jgi:hypothetical protein
VLDVRGSWSSQSAVVVGKYPDNGVTADTQQPPRQREQALHLVAALLIPQAPFAEVLAVVAQDSIAVLAEARTRAVRYLGSIKARLDVGSYPDLTPVREARQRNLCHGEAA